MLEKNGKIEVDASKHEQLLKKDLMWVYFEMTSHNYHMEKLWKKSFKLFYQNFLLDFNK